MAPARRAGLEVEYGGTAEALPVEPGGVGEVVGVVVAFVVLTVALSSLLAAGMPLLTALVGVGLGVIGVELVARWVELTNTAAVLATMLGLAVGIDYALFIIARHREQLADPGLGVRDSIGQAIATAGSAILFAGTTVIIALVSLSVAGIPFLTAMGLAAAATVLIAMLIAMTLVPAVLGFAGERLRPHGRRGHSPPGTWGRAWAKGISRAPIPVAVVGVAVLALLALPALHLRLGLPSNETQPAASTEHRGYDLLTEGFGPGFNATLAVVVDTRGVPSAQRGPVATALAGKLRADPGIAVVTAPIADPARSVAVISVVPKTGPDDDATSDLVHRLRDDDKAAATKAGAVVYVAGATATDLDVSTKLGHALPLFVAIIVVLALVLLTIAFRSLVVPITAALGFLLSVAAALGVVVWVFQDGHLDSVIGVAGAAPIVSFVPVLLIGVLFGLSMDYEVFLVSRMRESYDRDGDAAEAVAAGIEHSGRVVSAAALIMGSVFAGFVFTGDPIVKSIAFSLTVGVLIDAFVVRLTVIPAIMALLGARAWTVPGRF
jgi:RND superfamily putative drug exporter